MDGIREITASDEDMQFLARLYDGLYVAEFPDPDERESLPNMQSYLRKKAQGWYGASNYHILALIQDGAPTGLSISDYLARANAGVIEFILTDPARRRGGLGQRLLGETEAVLAADASGGAARGDGLPFCIAAETNDPAAEGEVPDNLDPVLRAGIWSRWGYRKLDFRYVQPALSPEQKPVEGLLLMAKPVGVPSDDALAGEQVRLILHEYMRLAMRIDRPDALPEYQRMSASLGESVRLLPLV
jgi:GNAT superfamily N-acetyltransferase